MNTGAFCKTEAVQTFKSLLKQRRRWFLGFITNEVCMLTDIRLWKRYPLLLVIRLAQNTIRTTALLFFILVISLLTTSQKVSNLPVGFIAVSLGLNWVLMIYFAAKLGRYKVVLYPLMFVVNPAFNWLYMVVSIPSKHIIVTADPHATVWHLHGWPKDVGWAESGCWQSR
jgi:chitin synthase